MHTSPDVAELDISEWASLFSSKVFVKLAAYIDESGRHDKSGQLKGAGHIVVSGWVDWRDNWAKFCGSWRAVLRKYRACYFHFAEWAEASRIVRGKQQPSSSYSKNPYKDWPIQKLDAFLYELAEIAGGGQKLPVGGFVSTKDFANAIKHPDFKDFPRADDGPYRACLKQFFQKFSEEVQDQWQYWTEPVAFFFDKNDDRDWSHAVYDAFSAAQKTDPRIAELIFVNSKIHPHWPLQAADMLAYRYRQICEKFLDPKILPDPSKLDELLIKPAMMRASPTWMKKAMQEYPSVAPLRYTKYPWREKS